MPGRIAQDRTAPAPNPGIDRSGPAPTFRTSPMRRIACLLLLLLALPLRAAPVSVPDPLAPWRDWALEDQQYRECALLAGHAGSGEGDFRCTWPGVLRIDADASGAQFAVR